MMDFTFCYKYRVLYCIIIVLCKTYFIAELVIIRVLGILYMLSATICWFAWFIIIDLVFVVIDLLFVMIDQGSLSIALFSFCNKLNPYPWTYISNNTLLKIIKIHYFPKLDNINEDNINEFANWVCCTLLGAGLLFIWYMLHVAYRDEWSLVGLRFYTL